MREWVCGPKDVNLYFVQVSAHRLGWLVGSSVPFIANYDDTYVTLY